MLPVLLLKQRQSVQERPLREHRVFIYQVGEWSIVRRMCANQEKLIVLKLVKHEDTPYSIAKTENLLDCLSWSIPG